MNRINITEFEQGDYREVYALWQAAGISLGASDEYAEILKFRQQNPDSFLVGREAGAGGMIAVCLGGFDGRRGYIHHLAVKPEFQKKGYGSQILEQVMQRLKQKGALKVHLFIESRNAGVVGFYDNAGWTKRSDIIVMSKVL